MEADVTRRWTEYSALIVEDCADYQVLLCKMVSALGFEVSVCDGGYEALEQLAGRQIDLIISDIHMSQGDGLWLLRQMRESKKIRTPVILISADMEVKEYLLLGANGFLRKPFNQEQLKSMVIQVMLV